MKAKATNRRPQKQKIYNAVQKNRLYYADDLDCKLCQFYIKKKKGCKLERCCCESEKFDAIVSGRIKRKKEDMDNWAM